MTEQNENKNVTLGEVSQALNVIAVLLGQITIPATRSQEFAVAINVLGELKAMVDSKLNPPQEPVQEAQVAVPEVVDAPAAE